MPTIAIIYYSGYATPRSKQRLFTWQLKKFADASSKPWFSRAWKDKIAGGSLHSGGRRQKIPDNHR